MRRFFLYILLFSGCCCLADNGSGRSLLFQNYFLEAMRQREKENHDAAYDLLSKCLEIDSMAPEAYYEIGVYQAQSGRDSLAEASFRKACELDSASTDYKERLAELYLQTQKLDEAARLYEEIYAAEKSRTDILDILQPLYQKQQDWKHLLAVLEEKEVVEPEQETLELEIQLKMFLKKPQDDTDKTIKKLLSVAPANIDARVHLLQKAFDNKDWDEAMTLCEGGVENCPEEPMFCYYLGLLYIQNDKRDEALDALQRGIRLSNENTQKKMVADMYASCGDLLHEKGRNEEAYDCYEKAIENDSTNIGCLNNYAYFLSIDGGDLNKAEKMSQKTIEAEPDNATYLDTYAWILHMQGRNAEALPYMEKAMKHLKKGENKEEYRKHLREIRK